MVSEPAHHVCHFWAGLWTGVYIAANCQVNRRTLPAWRCVAVRVSTQSTPTGGRQVVRFAWGTISQGSGNEPATSRTRADNLDDWSRV